jgi:hypothetical protein
VLSAGIGATRDRHFLKVVQVANLAGRRTGSMTSGFGMTGAVPWRFGTGRVAKAKKLLRRPRLLMLPHWSGFGRKGFTRSHGLP